MMHIACIIQKQMFNHTTVSVSKSLEDMKQSFNDTSPLNSIFLQISLRLTCLYRLFKTQKDVMVYVVLCNQEISVTEPIYCATVMYLLHSQTCAHGRLFLIIDHYSYVGEIEEIKNEGFTSLPG